MAVSGPVGYLFSTPASATPPVEITQQKCHSHEKHQGYSDSDVGRWDRARRVALRWARNVQLTNERANTLRLKDPGYGQEVHFRLAHNGVATTKQKADALIGRTHWLVELFSPPARLGNHWRSPM